MKRKTMMPERRGHGTYRRFALLTMMIFVVGSMSTSISACAAETGVKGTVLWGPVAPGPSKLGQNDEAPFSATFIVFAGEHQLAQFKSDKKGNFEVLLPAGDYTIVPDKSTPMPAPQSQTKKVTVPKDGFAVVTLRFDTGMR